MENPNNTALLIVDLQTAFQPSKEVIAEIKNIASQYKIVVATQFLNGNSLFQNILGCKEYSSKELKLCKLPTNAKVFSKTGYGLPEELITYLQGQGITKIDVCGFETEACVLASIFNLWDARIEPNVIEKLIGTPPKNAEYHKAAMQLIKKNFQRKRFGKKC